MQIPPELLVPDSKTRIPLCMSHQYAGQTLILSLLSVTTALFLRMWHVRGEQNYSLCYILYEWRRWPCGMEMGLLPRCGFLNPCADLPLRSSYWRVFQLLHVAYTHTSSRSPLKNTDPETASFLSEAEKQAILTDLPARAPSMAAKTFDLSEIKALLKSPTWVPFLLIWTTHGIGGFGITFVLPTIIYELGLSGTAVSQLMTMPAYALVFVILLALGYLTHTERLSPWAACIGLEVGQIMCYILLITVHDAAAKYVLVVVATAASSSFFPIIWPERIRATSGTTSAALAIGVTNVGRVAEEHRGKPG